MPGGNANACLLVVDDSPDARELLKRNLSSQGYEVLTASGMAEALSILAATHVDLVLTDLKMPHASGLDLVRHIHENLKDTEVIMVTGYPSVEGAVTAVKSGAQEYLSKPFTKDELLAAVGRVMEKLSRRKATRKAMGRQPSNPLGMVGESEPMLKVFKAALKAAAETTPVYLMGENGTGRELLAKGIHAASPRDAAPFVTINCLGTEPESFEKQLLGYVKELSPGAMESHEGLFQFLDGGTLHLKNVSQLPDGLQSKLFHILEEREFRAIGSTKAQTVNFRVIADSHRDLRVLVNAGLFREDLFVRLSMNAISIPPLRERGNDVLLLARHFTSAFANETGHAVPHFSDHALEVMKMYSWPGNLVELQNVVNQLVLTVETDIIKIHDLPAHMRSCAPDAVVHSRSLAEVEREHIHRVIASVGGNKTRAAEILGINRKTLREKLAQTNSPKHGP